MKFIDAQKLIISILRDTTEDKIEWKGLDSYSNFTSFRLIIPVTKKKFIKFKFYISRIAIDSYMLIYFNNGDIESYITTLNCKVYKELLDLVEAINLKRRVGKIKENMFFSDDPDTKSRGEKLKNIKLISNITTDTINNKLSWRLAFLDEDMSTFQSSYKITNNKELFFSLRCDLPVTNNGKYILRVLLKTDNPYSVVKSKTEVIKTLDTRVYHSLIYLVKFLVSKFLDKSADKTNDTGFTDNSGDIISCNDFSDYKKEIVKIVNKYRDKFSKDSVQYKDINKLIQSMILTTDYDEIGNLMFRAHEIANRPNPIGTPRWAR